MADVQVIVLVRLRGKRIEPTWSVAESSADAPTPHAVMEAARRALELAVKKRKPKGDRA